mgnify:FL=1
MSPCLAESEIYLDSGCAVSVGLHVLLQEALIHIAVTKVVAGEHLDIKNQKYFRYVSLSLPYLCAGISAGGLRRSLCPASIPTQSCC